MMTKRTEVVPIAIALVLSIFLVAPVASADGTVVVSIATDVGAAPGGTDTVPIVVDGGRDNMCLGSGIITVTYNPSVVHVTSVASGAGNALTVQSWTADNTEGRLIITSADGAQAHNGTVVFATVSCEAVGSCGDSSPLSITVNSLRDWYTYTQIPRTVSNGTFTIGGGSGPSLTSTSIQKHWIPGFAAISAIAGLLTIAYLVRGRKR